MEKEIDEKLQGVGTDRLLAEIERRKIERPNMIQNFAYGVLQNVCENHLNEISSGKNDSNFKNRIYKAAMEMWFGENVWNYINAVCID